MPNADSTHASRDLATMLGVVHPIVLAPMAGGTSTPALVAAVSNAGGLGSLGAAPDGRSERSSLGAPPAPRRAHGMATGRPPSDDATAAAQTRSDARPSSSVAAGEAPSRTVARNRTHSAWYVST